MVLNRGFIFAILIFGFCILLIGISLRKPKNDKRVTENADKDSYKYKLFSKNGMIERIDSSSAAIALTSTLGNTESLDSLFRRSKNPWNLTPVTYNFIRYGASSIAFITGLALLPLSWTFTLIFGAAGGMLLLLPKQKYESEAHKRENQWNQLYQFMWVIKHNLNFYDPKKTWLETEKYIHEHTDNLPELECGFKDFAAHWNGKYIDTYLKRTYGDFAIPKQLLDIVLTSQLTGEYPDKELTSLRQIILEKMNFHVQETLSTVGMKATMYSSPFLLVSVALIVLVPVLLQLIEALG